MKKKTWKKILAAAMAAVLITTSVPDMGQTVYAAVSATGDSVGVISTTDDPHTLTRPLDTYGNNTLNAGKILVGKSVTDGINDTTGREEPLDLSAEAWNMVDPSETVWTPDPGNFLVTISQSSQMYGVSSEIPVPLDVVFVLDTSGSMSTSVGNNQDRADAVVAAANSAIKTLLSANKDNRVGVVAFSGSNGSTDTTTVLTKLGHYDATNNHLTVNKSGNLEGQSGSRNVHYGGTNIQAGIAAGAKLLMEAKDDSLQVTYGDRTVTRIPILILLSDGAPTYSSSAPNWKNPTGSQNGRGSSDRGSDPGEGFLPMLVASYYKNAITQKYYGSNATSDQRAFVYTIGVGLGTISKYGNSYWAGDEATLANLTMNPSQWLDVSIGNSTIDDNIRSAWRSYQNKQDFTIQVGKYSDSSTTYAFKYHATSNQAQYNIDPSVTSLKYNDQYWLASNTEEINKAFSEVVIEIQKRAITVPTLTDVNMGENFSGFVTFTDPIGEYMEVKNILGVTGDGYLYQGKSLAQLAENYDPNWENVASTSEAQKAFNQAMEQAISDRIKFSTSGNTTPNIAQVRAILDVVTMTAAEGSASYNDGSGLHTFDYDTYGGQLYYNNDSDYGNSFAWFGKVVYPGGNTSATNDEYTVQFIGVAPKEADSAEWIQSQEGQQKLAQVEAVGANCIVRSYFMYGAAGGERTENPADMLHFQLRVITSLDAPYQQTVSIKAPASLLAMQKVLINDTDPNNLVAHYDGMIPTRVTYEVGLRSDITPDNVWSIVDGEYLQEYGNVNADGSFNFFTNSFVRYADAEAEAGHTGADHDHALTNATFDVAHSNSFYRYETDTRLLNAEGTPITSAPVAGQTYYYSREYYIWTPGSTPGQAPATKSYQLIAITAPDNWTSYAERKNDGYWYIKEGSYTAGTVTVGDDLLKSANETGSAHVISHPERTNDANDSHYTVWLGNNGKLTYMGVPAKTVMRDDPATSDMETANIDGQIVKVGDVLTYQIQVTNPYDEAVTVNISDVLPAGTALVDGSVMNGTKAADGTITVQATPSTLYSVTTDASGNKTIAWSIPDVASQTTVVVRFDVQVVESSVVVKVINNAAQITMPEVSNSYTTNMTSNPVVGKKVAVSDGSEVPEGGVTVGTQLQYQIAYFNTKDTAAEIVITDIIPEGTIYVAESASRSPVLLYEDSQEPSRVTGLRWTFDSVEPGKGGVVTFNVIVGAGSQEDGMADGVHHDVNNHAVIVVDNDPEIVTNETNTQVKEGDLAITKELVNSDSTQTFTLTLTERRQTLNGTYVTTTTPGAAAGTVTFVNGVATLQIQGGQTIQIADLPAGAVITVAENTPGNGFTHAIAPVNGVVTIPADSTAAVQVTVTNTYSASPAEVVLGGTKYFTNNGLYDETRTFTFELKETDADGTVLVGRAADLIANAQMIAAAGQTDEEGFSFAKLTYTGEGTFYYLLTEVDNNLTGVTYDLAQYRIKVVVADNDLGQLVATVYWYDDSSAAADKWTAITADANGIYGQDVLTYENKYAPLREELSLIGEKSLQNAILSDNQFSFLVEERVWDATANNGAGEWIYEQRVTGQSKADGSIVFTTIVYTEPGEHIYRITEVTGATNMLYGGETYYIKVVVTEDNGVLYKKVYQGASDTTDTWTELTSDQYGTKASSVLEFSNIYDPGYTSVVLRGTKTLTGRDMAVDEFDFVVNEYTPATGTSDAVIGAEVASGSNVAAENGVAAQILFQAINYTLADLGSDKTETFYYIVREVNEGKDGITYSGASYIVEVVVTYSDASGWSTRWSVIEGGSAIAFTNSYTPDPIDVYLTLGQKTTTGANLPDGLTFGYEVIKAYSSVDDGVDVGAVVASGTSGANTAAGTAIALSALTFSQPGTYKAWLYEINGGQTVHGITYDNARYLLEIVVTQDPGTGILSADVQSYAAVEGKKGSTDMADYTVPAAANFDNVVFTNDYNARGSLTIEAIKKVTGRILTAGAYEFELVEANGTRHTGTNDASGKIVFDTLNYTADDLNKNFVYIMREVTTGVAHPGVAYDKSEYQVTVTLARDPQDNQKIIPSYTIVKIRDRYANEVNPAEAVTGWPTFENVGSIYQGVSTTVTLTKTLIGRAVENGEFSFVLNQISPAPVALEDTTQVVAGNAGEAQNVVLDISISAAEGPGTYVFEISEINNHTPGVTYDQSVYRVEVVVDDTNSDGILDIVSKTITQVKDKDGKDMTATAVTTPSYINSYMADHVDVILVAGKTLNGRTMKEGEFGFSVYEIVRDQNDEIVDRILRATGSNDASGEVVFTPVTFTKTGTYEFEVVEISTSPLPGVTHDTKVYSVIVVVTDDTVNGKLVATVTVDGQPYDQSWTGAQSSIQFVNEYKTIDAKVKLEGTKTLTGRDMNAGEFTFYTYLIKEEIGGNVKNYSVGDVRAAVGSNAAGADGVAAMIDFATITYSKAGIYTYVVVEAAPDAGKGLTQTGTKEFQVVVTVVDDGKGNLVPTVSYPADIAFNNTYDPTDIYVPIQATKDLTGKVLNDKEFTFEVKDAADQVIAIGYAMADGFIVFDYDLDEDVDADDKGILFDKGGTYTFKIKEVAGTNANMTYDTTEQTITITITDDGLSNLSAAIQYQNNAIVFNNVYVPTEIPVPLDALLKPNGSKELDGRELLAGEFSFEVKDVNGNVVAIAHNLADGTIVFDYDMDGDVDDQDKGIMIPRAGIYRYTIAEVTSGKPGVTDDPAVWTVQVEVVQDPVSGVLSIRSLTILGVAGSTADPADGVVFTNTYDAEDIPVTLTGTKKMLGNRNNVKEGEFTFHLIDLEDDSVAARGTTRADGTIVFETIVFDQVVTKHYKVVEIPGNAEGMTYDNAVYYVTIEVTEVMDGGQYAGRLQAQVTILDENNSAADIIYENTYHGTATSASVMATKVMVGRKLTAHDVFTFTLTPDGGNPAQVTITGATNDASGNIVFNISDIKEAGTYTFKMAEVASTDNRIHYSTKVIDVTVVVKDNQEGKLYVESVTYSEDPVFTNVYTPDPATPVVPVGTKTLTNRDNGTFYFGVYEWDPATGTKKSQEPKSTGTVTITEAGVPADILFDAIGYSINSFTVDCDGQSTEEIFTYVMEEMIPTAGADPQITYDRSQFTFQVRLTYDTDTGLLTAAIVDSGWQQITDKDGVKLDSAQAVVGAAFKNLYTPPEDVVLNEVSAWPEIVKNVTSGYNDGEIPAGLNFGFQLIKAADAKAPDGSVIDDGYQVGDVVGSGDSTATVGGAHSEETKITFSALTFYQPGTYQAWIVENNAGQEIHGVLHDDVRYLVVIEVVEEEDGSLTPTVKYYGLENGGEINNVEDYTVAIAGENSQVEFDNIYTAKGLLNIATGKILDHEIGSSRPLTAGMFDFTLTEVLAVDGNGYPTRYGTQHIGSNTAEGYVLFDTLTFINDGFVSGKKTLTYIMKETEGVIPGITYDKSEYLITVELTEKDGAIIAEVVKVEMIVNAVGTKQNPVNEIYNKESGLGTAPTINNGVVELNTIAAFTNVARNHTGAFIEIPVVKTLAGRDMKAEEFAFTLTHVATSINGVDQPVTPTVVEAIHVGNSADGVPYGDMKFVREYSAAVVPGTVITYHVAEVQSDKGGISYDKSVYEVKVKITDANTDGDLEADIISVVKIQDALDATTQIHGLTASDISFVNGYKVAEIDFILEGAGKTLNGREISTDEFAFEVYEIAVGGIKHTDKVLIAEGTVETTEESSTAAIVFDEITYSAAGVYEYEIVEKAGTAPNVTYSQAVYKMVVTVTENQENGTLSAVLTSITQTVKDDGTVIPEIDQVDETTGEAIQFTNTYIPDPAAVVLHGFKVLNGRNIVADEFTFQLQDVIGKVITTEGHVITVTNDAEGNVVFPALQFTAEHVGEHVFLVNEVIGDNDNIEYTDVLYEVIVRVTDNKQGQIEVEVTVDGVPYDSALIGENAQIQFVNEFNPDPTTAVIQATKKLTGRDLKVGEFTFVINDENGLLVAVGTNDAEGNITFQWEKQLGKGEHVLTISEQHGNLEYVTYDTNKYQVTVKVTDVDLDGVLEAAVEYPDGGVVFNNIYEEPVVPTPEPDDEDDPEPTPNPPAANPDTGDTANVGLWISLMGISLLVAAAVVVVSKRRRRV